MWTRRKEEVCVCVCVCACVCSVCAYVHMHASQHHTIVVTSTHMFCCSGGPQDYIFRSKHIVMEIILVEAITVS